VDVLCRLLINTLLINELGPPSEVIAGTGN